MTNNCCQVLREAHALCSHESSEPIGSFTNSWITTPEAQLNQGTGGTGRMSRQNEIKLPIGCNISVPKDSWTYRLTRTVESKQNALDYSYENLPESSCVVCYVVYYYIWHIHGIHGLHRNSFTRNHWIWQWFRYPLGAMSVTLWQGVVRQSVPRTRAFLLQGIIQAIAWPHLDSTDPRVQKGLPTKFKMKCRHWLLHRTLWNFSEFQSVWRYRFVAIRKEQAPMQPPWFRTQISPGRGAECVAGVCSFIQYMFVKTLLLFLQAPNIWILRTVALVGSGFCHQAWDLMSCCSATNNDWSFVPKMLLQVSPSDARERLLSAALTHPDSPAGY